MTAVEDYVAEQLFAMQDLKYRTFHCGLMPTVAAETVIGVRTPQLRQFAKEFSKEPAAAQFLQILPHRYYEENNLHGFLIEGMKDYNQTIAALDKFLPFVNNWATCDLMCPKVFSKYLPELLDKLQHWLQSGQTYTIRFAIGMLMRFYLDDHFCPEYPKLVAAVQSEEYYVRMMVAWYFATALAKQYDAVLPWITQNRLDPWTHNKTIQKAMESNRISDEQKAFLRNLRLKNDKKQSSVTIGNAFASGKQN